VSLPKDPKSDGFEIERSPREGGADSERTPLPGTIPPPTPSPTRTTPIGSRTPVPRRDPVSRRAAEEEVVPPAPAWPRVRRVFLLLGLVLAATIAWTMFNPEFGTVERAWPWDVALGRVEGAEAWSEARVLAAEASVFAVLLLVACLLPRGRSRGILGAVVAGLGFAATMTHARGATPALHVAVALAAGAVLWLAAPRLANRPRPGARVLLAAALAVVAVMVLVPVPSQSGVETSRAASLLDSLRSPPEGTGLLDVLWNPEGIEVSLAVLVLALGLVAFLGLGGRWSGGAAALLAVLLVLLAPLRVFVAGMDGEGEGSALQEGLRGAVEQLRAGLGPFLLPLVAAVLDVARPDPSP
jgi:hypothetical protein